MNAKAGVAALMTALLFAVLTVGALTQLVPPTEAPVSPPWIGEALWTTRALGLAVQAFIVLAGVFTIVLLLREEPEGARGG